MLFRSATDREAAIAREALLRLREIDLKLSLPAAISAIASLDAGLRQVGVEILVASGDIDAIQHLGPMLDDRNPGVRQYVAAHLVAFANQPDLRASVIDQAMKSLAGNGWRGVEQAALIAGTLDHKPAAARLLVSLDNPRPEASVASAWALRKLKKIGRAHV